MRMKVFIVKINCVSYDLRKSDIYWRGSKPFQRYIGVKVPISWLAMKQSCQNRQSTYGLSRFFSSGHGKTISLAFFGLSLVSVKERRSYPMLMEQIVRGDTCRSAGNLPPP